MRTRRQVLKLSKLSIARTPHTNATRKARRVSFTVEPMPDVLQAVSNCSPSQRDFFDQVMSILSQTPYEFREVIQRHVGADGRVFYTYYDGVIPLVFTYRVYPPKEEWAEGQPRYVPITRAERPWW
jgi:hypothetical protein